MISFEKALCLTTSTTDAVPKGETCSRAFFGRGSGFILLKGKAGTGRKPVKRDQD